MKDGIKFTIVVLLFSLWAFPRCVEANEPPDVPLWLARSCVGESGWDTHKTGECAAIIHIYRKRSEVTGKSIYEVARKYSAAIKHHKGHPNPWVKHLDRMGTKPKGLPTTVKWDVLKPIWLDVLAWVDTFVANPTPDPVPLADHYGGEVDHALAMKKGWWKLNTPFKNNFYSVTNPKKKGEQNVSNN